MTALSIAAAGWLGAACMLVAYVLVSVRRITGHGAAFQWLNIGGGVGLAVNGAANGAFPSAVLNVIWIAIGASVLLRSRGLLSASAIRSAVRTLDLRGGGWPGPTPGATGSHERPSRSERPV